MPQESTSYLIICTVCEIYENHQSLNFDSYWLVIKNQTRFTTSKTKAKQAKQHGTVSVRLIYII